ncbi:unnamed protein product, partial [Mesorhabditis belari]|uniref:receptor protein-tyrosine kinase n=1 Tax=Mesorhabditis belari TaxID=2138241 RepID=A0AAF3JAN7_9BILA
MQEYVVVVVTAVVGIFFICLIIALCICLFKNRAPMKRKKPERATSRVYPRISSPIYAISHNSIDKKNSGSFGGDTLRKLSMFERKRPQAFQKSFYGYEDSPRVAHKEYLDFSQIESILPMKQTRSHQTRPTLEYYQTEYYRTERSQQKSEDQGSFDSEETASTHMSKESLEEQPKPQLIGISVIEDRPFSGNRRSFDEWQSALNSTALNAGISSPENSTSPNFTNFQPVREIYRENNVSFDKK